MPGTCLGSVTERLALNALWPFALILVLVAAVLSFRLVCAAVRHCRAGGANESPPNAPALQYFVAGCWQAAIDAGLSVLPMLLITIFQNPLATPPIMFY